MLQGRHSGTSWPMTTWKMAVKTERVDVSNSSLYCTWHDLISTNDGSVADEDLKTFLSFIHSQNK